MDTTDLRAYISSFEGSAVVVLLLAVVTAVVVECVNQLIIKAVAKKPWWSSAEPLQKQLMMNFGYPEEACTPEVLVESYAFVLVGCGHHFLIGSLMIPVIVYGWSGAGSTGQLLFMMAVLEDVGYDVYDFIKKFCLTFFPSKCKCLGAACPLPFFIIVCCIHHMLALTLVIPMNLKYAYLPEYHTIACSLLLAAGICFLSGQYKFTLSMKDRGEFLQFKAIVLIQFLTVWYTRCLVWFPNAYAILTIFYGQGDSAYFYGGLVGSTLMSLFNIIMLIDATVAALKWLPKSPPASEDDHDDLKFEIARQQSNLILPASDKVLGLGARKVRVSIGVSVAAQRFKKPLLESGFRPKVGGA